jgi:hypothetical protein
VRAPSERPTVHPDGLRMTLRRSSRYQRERDELPSASSCGAGIAHSPPVSATVWRCG